MKSHTKYLTLTVPGKMTFVNITPEVAQAIRDDKRVARLMRTPNLRRPQPGLGKGMLTIMSDVDEHLKAYADSMPAKGK